MKKILFILISIIILFCSCTKERFIDHPIGQLYLKMGDAYYNFDTVTSAKIFTNCGRYQIRVQALKVNDEFFDINITGDSTAIRPGIYTMGEVPTNSVSQSCTFWYTHYGNSYTAKNFTITVTSFHNGILNGYFSGGIIEKGQLNNIKITQ